MRELKAVLETEFGLDLDGWELQSARGISANGLVIAGQGINPDGEYEAWIATLPEPSTGVLVSLGLLGFALVRSR